MNFFQKIRALPRQIFNSIKTVWTSGKSDFTNWAGRTFLGFRNNTLETNETVFSIITRLSGTLASLPLKEYKQYTEQQGTTITELLANPNVNMSGYQLISQLEVSRNRDGNGYAMIIRDKKLQPEQIIPVPASYVHPFINMDDSTLWYEITAPNFHVYLSNNDMLHVRHIHGPESLIGISPLDVLKNALDYDKAVAEYSLSEMDKMDSFIVNYDNFVDREQKDALIENFSNYFKDNGGVLFQEKGTEIKPIDKTFKPGDVGDSDKITRLRIANAFNVPLTFLNDGSGTGVNSNEQVMIQFVQTTLTTIVKQYESEFNKKLLTSSQRKAGYYFKFSLNGLLRGDMATRTEFYQAVIRNGVYTPNDIRVLEDKPPVDDESMDKTYISGDLYPIDMDPSLRKGVKTSAAEENKEVLGNGEGTGIK